MFSVFNMVLYATIAGACVGFFELDAFGVTLVLAAVAAGQGTLLLWEE